jgi:ribosomal protein S18 acetylase RimI-like enzyme
MSQDTDNQTPTICLGFGEDQRQSVAEVLFDAFERKLSPLLGDRVRGTVVLAAGLNPASTLVASQAGQVLGVAGLKYGDEGFMNPQLSQFTHTYGWLMGRLRRLLYGMMESPSPTDHQVMLDMLAVSAQVRGKGIGTRLLHATFDFARDHGCREVWLDVVDTNQDAQRLYGRMGFRPVKVQHFPIIGPWMGFHSTTIMTRTVD